MCTRKVSLFLVIVTFFTGGCSVRSSLPTSTSASAILPVRTITPTALQLTVTPTRDLSSTATPAAGRTSTQINTATSFPPQMQYQCLDIVSAPSASAQSSGVITMFDGNTSTYLLDMRTGAKTTFTPEKSGFLTDFKVSPDGKWLAYWLNNNRENPSDSRLFIAEPNGQTQKEIPWEENWRMIVGWLDNNRLLINRKGVGQYDLDSLIVLNPFSEQLEELTPTYPDINKTDFVFWNFSRLVIEPTISRVVYAAYGKESNNVVLWDIYNNAPIATIPVILSSSSEPKWSPDGNRVLLEALKSKKPSPSGTYDVELYSISFEGMITRLTYLTEEYSVVGVRNFSWSPDGNRIAFWVRTEPSQFTDQRLAVLDTLTGDVTNYCIPGSINGDAPAPIWSPDGKQIVIANKYDENYNIHVILVDLVGFWTAQIAENVTPVGWMK